MQKKRNYNFNEIPDELKALPQWIVWKEEVRNGKYTKVPYQVNGEEAQSNNRRTWSTFPTAVKTYIDQGYNGIGFVFSNQDTYIGIDIDNCVVDEVPNELASKIIDMMDSYTEFSPSGEGIHIIVKGNLPDYISGTGRRNTKLGLEVYRHGRYFTFTGNKENGNDVVHERTDELEELFETYLGGAPEAAVINNSNTGEIKLSNAELWKKMFSAANGEEIKSLFAGNLVNNDHSGTDLALCSHLAFWTGRNAIKMDSMFRESGLMRDKWDVVHHSSGETYGERTIGYAIENTQSSILDEFDSDYSITIHNSDEDAFKPATKNFMRTELGNAERIVSEYGNDIRFVDDAGWYIWDGKRWKEDRRREIEKITAKVLRKLFKGNEEERKWAKTCEKRSVRMNSIKDMIPMVPAEREDFDAHKYLFNVSNGVLDLQKGKLYPHDRDYMMTKISNVEFDEKAQCPNWISFLESIFKNKDGSTDYELIEFMQRAIGYSLTGDISEQVMFFLFGGGRNGKSTFINIVQNLLGDYGRQTNSDTFIKKNNDSSINNDIARLHGSRFVSAVESEDGQKLSVSLVKQITGGERILARFLRQEFFEFEPEFKVFFTTNHKPIIHEIDEGTWRRVKLIPFTVTIPKESIDKKLPEKLSMEMSGILNWAIEGCLKWQKDGLGDPASVRGATDDYKEKMDILEPFIFERCSIDPNESIKAVDLFRDYENWCCESGENGLRNRAFYRMLETKGYNRERGAGNHYFVRGLTLKENYPVFHQNKVTELDQKRHRKRI